MTPLNTIVLLTMVNFVTGRLSTNGNMGHPYMHHTLNFDSDQSQQYRSLATDAEQKLQFALENWNLCTNAFSNKNFTPMNSLVPNNTVFLAPYPTFNIDNSSVTCRDKTITRIGTINTGRQTIFLPVWRLEFSDYEDDWELGICANSTNETLTQRLEYAEESHLTLTNATFRDALYYDIDGKAAEPVYLYDTTEYHLRACEDNRTNEEYYKSWDPNFEGDPCDAEPFQLIDGLDVYPILGWWGIDIREWVDGETHVYEFGNINVCVTGKYVLTAKAEVEKSSTSKGTGQSPFWLFFGICTCIWMLLWSIV